MRDLLKQCIPSLTDKQCDKFVAYYHLLTDWNARMNLTAITSAEDAAKKHFADSLASLSLISPEARIADIGTGAGFPGVPLLIMRPDIRLTLVDSLQKRITFLEVLLKELDLSAECIHARAEDFGRLPAYRGQFDLTVTRAVSSLPVLIELTVPLLKIGGKSICYKGDAKDELNASKTALHLLHASADVLPVSSDYGVRSLIVCTKNAPTPGRYPRKAGVPAKDPL
jgi:16S rRNA (guanine(527)-N(7))-methyltransferase GidB